MRSSPGNGEQDRNDYTEDQTPDDGDIPRYNDLPGDSTCFGYVWVGRPDVNTPWNTI